MYKLNSDDVYFWAGGIIQSKHNACPNTSGSCLPRISQASVWMSLASEGEDGAGVPRGVRVIFQGVYC